jgi:uncharacterized phage infection (PIP) family protein YhgE
MRKAVFRTCLASLAFALAAGISIASRGAPTNTTASSPSPADASASSEKLQPASIAPLAVPLTVRSQPRGVSAPAPEAAESRGVEAATATEGPFANELLNDPRLRMAEQLKSDSRFERLSAAVKADFSSEFANLMLSKTVPSRDLLLDEAHNLDTERSELVNEDRKLRDAKPELERQKVDLAYRVKQQQEGVAHHNKMVATFNAKNATLTTDVNAFAADLRQYNATVQGHNAEVANYDAQCAGRRLPEPQYSRCVAWQNRLNARKAQLDAQKAQIEARRSQLIRRKAELDAQIPGLQANKKYLDDWAKELIGTEAALNIKIAKYNADIDKLSTWHKTFDDKRDFWQRRVAEWLTLVDKFSARLKKALEG